MRQPGVRRSVALAAAILGASALTAACGQVQAGSGSAAASSQPSAAACSQPASPVSATQPLTVSTADNHKSICIKRGDGVFVYLHGTPDHKWTAIQASSTAMERRANGRLALALGVTGAYFVAVHPGTVTLDSSRTPCPTAQPSGPATSGPQCAGQESVFQVTLVITG